jgi:hypothetical protein
MRRVHNTFTSAHKPNTATAPAAFFWLAKYSQNDILKIQTCWKKSCAFLRF